MSHPTRPPEYLMEDSRSLDKNEQRWSIYNTHDPSIFKDGDTYYVFSTDTKTSQSEHASRSGVQIRRSKNLVDWEWVGYAFEGVPKDAFAWTNAKGLWAPDIVKWGDTYYLYYCASQFGTNQSFIGVATSDSIAGPWTDQGEVWKTSKQNSPNAIDPNIICDRDGIPYLIYGSFFGGIYAARLNKETGKLEEHGEGLCIARREHETKKGALEGPYIIYQPEFDMYYLFVSYDSLFSNYNVRVGRSKSVLGPYLDYNGNHLTDIESRPSDEIGTKVLAGYQFSDGGGWMAPGHNSILQERDNYFIVHHARVLDKKDTFALHIRRVLWTKSGWPVISPERYAGEELTDIADTQIAGVWDVVRFDRQVDGVNQAKQLVFADNKVRVGEEILHWELVDGRTVYLKQAGETRVEIKVLPVWDWERQCQTIAFTGMDKDGTSIFGKKID